MPRSHLYKGWYQHLLERFKQAQKQWHKSLECARQLAMPYEEALAHYEIGRHLPVDDPARSKHLHQAIEIFTRLAAAYDLERAQVAAKKNN